MQAEPAAAGHTSYDDIPYGNLAFAQTHPDRLATVGRLFGLATPAVGQCRVLELGCASGGNLIPMAFNLPGAEFVGVDLARRHVEAAQATIQALGLTNVRIRQGSISEIDGEWGRFDYIICHGVFSWVAADVQRTILRVAHDNLTEHGVAYVSYNTYPGWHMRESVRHMMRYHAGRFDDIPEQIEQARALLAFLGSAVDDGGAYGQLLAREIERLAESPDSYLYHEHLEQTNVPLYFHQFVERAEAAGLQYLAEADVGDMLSSVFGDDVANTLERISPDLLHLEQYMDFVRNRLFRQTLLCRAALKPRRALTPNVLHGLMLSFRAAVESAPDLASDQPAIFHRGPRRAEVKTPASKAAFAVLMEAWPRAVDVDELCGGALERAAPFLGEVSRTEATGTMLGDLLRTVLHGMVGLHTAQVSCANCPSDTPRANALAAYQLATQETAVNARHETVKLDELTQAVMRLADGRRTRREIVDLLVQRVARGAIQVHAQDQVVTDVDAARPLLILAVDEALASLTRAALLVE